MDQTLINFENDVLIGHLRIRTRLSKTMTRKLIEFGRKPSRLFDICRKETLVAEQINQIDPDLFRRYVQKAWDRGIRSVSILDRLYPERLLTIAGYPPVLYYFGNHYEKIIRSSYSVSIVGSRKPTEYGRRTAMMISRDLAQQGIVITSGLAIGIDAIAHQAALDSNGYTVAVVAGGPDIIYPRQNMNLINGIINRGILISEYPPGIQPRRHHFPARNRLLSGLSEIVAVIEATQCSGTMITAGFAADHGRDVFAVPGRIDSPMSEGCHQLIQEGAEILMGADDIIRRLPAAKRQLAIDFNR